jgi:hypothetical protein
MIGWDEEIVKTLLARDNRIFRVKDFVVSSSAVSKIILYFRANDSNWMRSTEVQITPH